MRKVACLLAGWIGCCAAGVAGEITTPTNPAELAAQLSQLRRAYAPYLRSLPEPFQVRSRADLVSPWRMNFELAKAADSARPEPPPWFAEDLDDSGWEKVTVPEWRYAAEGVRKPVSCIVWYRTRFPAGPKQDGRRVFLVFGGVEWEAEVWLNGKFLGRHKVYYEPFRFDVTSLLHQSNTLAVRVIAGPRFGEPIAYWSIFPDVPAGGNQRYVRDRAASVMGHKIGSQHLGSGFGIHREVYLETTGTACVSDVFVRNDLSSGEAKVLVETDAAAAQELAAEVRILPENFEGRVYEKTVACRVPKGTGRQSLSIPMPAAKTWSPQSPCLYRCRVALRDGQRLVDARDVLFGCRSLAVVTKGNPREGLPEGMFLLNGRPIFLRGTNVSPWLNAFWYWGEQEKLIEAILMLKAANFNAIRACQHVHYPEVRELLDRLGMMSEQDQGGGRNGDKPEAMTELALTGTALARACYNNPGVVLLSFANETHFDPTRTIRAVLAADPQRIIVPISGNYSPKQPGYALPDALWNNVIDDRHWYWGWYSDAGQLWKLSKRHASGRLITVGEYGAEGLDGYETMLHYPPHDHPADGARTTPPRTAETLWGAIQTEKADVRQLVGFRGKRPANLGQYIDASQAYQADVLAEMTKGFRLSPRSIGGYFQFHFLDALPGHWPKAIVSYDLRPKKAYFEMAQANQPLVPLFQLVNSGKAMEVWVANDLPEALAGGHVEWTVAAGEKTLAAGRKSAEVPALDAVLVETADLSAVHADVGVVTISLVLSDSAGKRLAKYRREVYLDLWRKQDALLRPWKPEPKRK